MANNVVTFTVNLNGNAYKGAVQIDKAVQDLTKDVKQAESLFDRLGRAAFSLNNIFGLASGVISSVTSTMQEYVEANKAQQEAETKLAQVMRNTMDASEAQIQSIKDLTAAQQELGVVGDEVQLAGAQELSTYLEKTSSLEALIPVMNDMIAQQYGLNASQESAVGIATMMGKVMEGQVGALSRYGYNFDKVQEKILKFGTEEQRAAVLAEVITNSVGGMNAALAATPEGKMQQIANAMGDFKERIGAAYVGIQSALLPVIEQAMGIVEQVVSFVEQHATIISGAILFIVGAISTTIDVVNDLLPLIIGMGTAVGVLTAALRWQDIVLDVLIAKETLVTMVTNLWSAAQTVLNTILAANPIGLIIAAIAALIGLVVTIVRKWEEWGAALTLFMGPLGAIIALVQSFRQHWESVVQAFQTEGIIGGIKRIGVVMLDALLMPVQQLLEMLSKIPGVGKLAEGMLGKVTALRDRLNLSTGSGAREAVIGANDQLAAATSTTTAGATTTDSSKESATKGVTTGGTRNTEIHINIGDMIREVHFNGGTRENTQEIERNFAECLYRVLGMAQASVR